MSDSVNVQAKYELLSRSPAQTFDLGRALGQRLFPGSVIALIGELGCGKTLFTKGICAGLDVPERQVNSPTFAFVNEYQGRLLVFHIDLYRIADIEDGFGIGLVDYLGKAKSGAMVLEWAEKALSLLPADHLQVRFEVLSLRKRRLDLIGHGEAMVGLVRELDKR
jgi:tRNA threonylcarbamoyladenosine biosynthesis protein TsaE